MYLIRSLDRDGISEVSLTPRQAYRSMRPRHSEATVRRAWAQMLVGSLVFISFPNQHGNFVAAKVEPISD